MLIPPVMPRAATITMPGGKPADYYEISMRQFQQQILPTDAAQTTVWGYGAVTSASSRGLLIHNAPSLTIEAMHNRPVRVKWINDLVDANGGFLPHLLPVDPTLHWANPPGGVSGRDMRPEFTTDTPGRTTARCRSSPTCTGPSDVGDESDGYAEAWYLPAASNIPAGTPPRAPGTTSSPARRPPATARPGDPDSPRSSTRTRTARPPSGTTTTRWA